MAGPAFAVVGRGEETVDLLGVDGFDGDGGLAGAKGHRVGDLRGLDGLLEGVDLLGGGREADQIVGNAAQESLGVGGRIRLQAFLLELGEDERVDGRLDPCAVLHFGNGRLGDGLEGPVIAGLARKSGELGRAAGRHRRAHLHPLFEDRDLVVRQLAARLLGRHRELGIGVADGLDQERFLEIARNDRRPFVAALEGAVAGIEDEAALRGILAGGVALIASIAEDRAHVLLEELEAFLGRLDVVGGDGEGGRAEREDEGGMTERQHGRVS